MKNPTTKNEKLYSPREPLAYTRPCAAVGRVGIGRDMVDLKVRPQWNLYWLSDPALDYFLGDVLSWNSAPMIDLKMLEACFTAVKQEVAGLSVRSLLQLLSPVSFVKQIRVGPYQHLAPYRLRGAPWLTTIERRAEQFRGAIDSAGNVQFVSFGRKVLDAKVDTALMKSATIMLLSSRKTD